MITVIIRHDSSSRQAAVSTITERANSSLDWPPIFVFPEGTTTNGKVLIRFQLGAFKVGTPVQPVIICYSNPRMTTWTRVNGGLKGFLRSLLLILSTPVSTISVQFLPVYHPSKQELDGPDLFARNVQKLIADNLKIEATNWSLKRQ